MPQTKGQRKSRDFFGAAPTAEDEAARQREVASLLPPRRAVIQELPIERIRPNPFQARRQFTNLEELSAAIQAQGFITRLRVRPDPVDDGYFQLAFGERRLRAALLAGLTTVPCEVADHTDDELFEIGLAENIQRRDLEPLEEARAFHILIEERGYSIRRLAERIGKDKGYVQDRIVLLRVPQDVQRMIEQRPDTLRIAREIGKLATAEERRPLIEGVIAGQVNTEDVRSIVRTVTGPAALQTSISGEASSTATGEQEDTQADLAEEASVSRVVSVDGVPVSMPLWEEDGPGKLPGSAAESAGGMRDAGVARAAREARRPAASMRRDMGTVRVILARWHKALPDMTVMERAALEDYIQEIEGASARLRLDLHEMNV
ncbi:MAG: ParB/RepB/Spo0J family partition protein, partial [Chloroflexi bacterium]|nr:ParB/RepB/Spo0J family partition protein [Chloroflexota bacterium]